MGNISSMARAYVCSTPVRDRADDSSTALDSYVAELGNDISYDKR